MKAYLAAILPPITTIPAGLILGAFFGWYWLRLGAVEVAESRRRIRRASIVLMCVAATALTAALSFVDGEREPDRYAIVWSIFIALLWLVIMSAMIDAMNTLRLHRREKTDMRRDAARGLAEAMRRRSENGDVGQAEGSAEAEPP